MQMIGWVVYDENIGRQSINYGKTEKNCGQTLTYRPTHVLPTL